VNWSTSFGFIPVLAERLGATDVTQSILMSLYIGVSLVGNLVTTAIVDRVGQRALVCASFLLASFGLGSAALASSLPLVFVSQISIGISLGVAYPLLMGLSIQDVEDRDRTIAMGLHQAIYGAGMFAGPGLSGLLASLVGIRPMFGVTALLCLLPFVLINRCLAKT
jgi:MFS family permease